MGFTDEQTTGGSAGMNKTGGHVSILGQSHTEVEDSLALLQLRNWRCPDCGAPLVQQSGCGICMSCGYSRCG